jgi:hypothetical protein
VIQAFGFPRWGYHANAESAFLWESNHMTKSDADQLNELIAAFSTVIVETTRAICRNSNGNIRRDLISRDIQKKADALPDALNTAKRIMSNIAAQLDDKTFRPFLIQPFDK